MAYAILRVEKTKTGAIAGKNSHNMRLRETKNADPNLKEKNRVLIGSGDLRKDINNRFSETNVKARNSTSVICNELLLTASKDFFEKSNLENWIDTQLEYLKSEFGDNCVNVVLHLDEQTPHIHAFITPIEFKNDKYKLNNKSYMKDYKTMQDIYFNHNKKLGLERGISKEITQAEYTQVKEFYSEIVNVSNKADVEIENNKLSVPKLPEREQKKGLFRTKIQETHFTGAEVNRFVRKASKPYREQNRELTKRVEGFKRSYKRYKKSYTELAESFEAELRHKAKEEAQKLTEERTRHLKAEIESLKGSVSYYVQEAKTAYIHRDNAIIECKRILKENEKLEQYKVNSDVLTFIQKYKPLEFKHLLNESVKLHNNEYEQKQQKNEQKLKTLKPL